MIKIDARRRLFFVLAIVLAFGFLGGSIINYSITKNSIHSEILQNDLPLTMNNIYSDVTSKLTRPLLVSSSMSADTFLKDWVMEGEQDQERMRKYLLEIKEKYHFFSTFFISSHTLRYYHFKGIHKIISPDDSHDVWYYRFIDSGRDYDLDVDNDEAGNNILTVFINYRVEDENGRLLGVAGVGLKMESVARLVKEYKERYGRNVYLTNKAGLIQVHQDASLIEKVKIADIKGLKDISQRILAVTAQPENFEYLKDGDKILLNVRYIDSLKWLLFVEQNETDSLHTARMNLFWTIALGIVTSITIFFITLITINRYQRRLEILAVSDELTSAANRRKLEEEFVRFASRFDRIGQPFSVILMDLDKFKAVNDTLGHIQGDEVLRTISRLLQQAIRPTEVFGRWGGDEFVILTESHLQDALLLAERVRSVVEQISWSGGGLKPGAADPREAVTLSIGVAQYQEKEGFSGLVARADQALYHSKQEGGNLVMQSGDHKKTI